MGCSEKNDWIVELYLPESLHAFVCKVLEKIGIQISGGGAQII